MQHRQRVIRNAAKCKICGKVVESTYVHDFVACDCRDDKGLWKGAIGIFVDGGHEYLRRGGDFENFIDLSETELEVIPCVDCDYFQNSAQNIPYCYHDVRVNPPAMPVILYGIGSHDTFKDCPMIPKEDDDA